MTAVEEQWIEDLYLELYDLLFGYAYGILNDVSQSEEAVQETFRIACDKVASLRESPNPHGWLMNTLKGVLQNQLRRNRKQSDELPEGEMDPLSVELLYGNVSQSKEFKLLQAISEGETTKEIAQRLGITEGSCKKRVQRSRRYLKNKIKLKD